MDETIKDFASAQRLFKEGRHPQAEAVCREILAANPADSRAMHLLGWALGHQFRKAESADWLIKAAETDLTIPEHQNDAGIVLLARGDAEGAAAAYRRAIALKPDFVEPHSNLGKVLRRQGKLEEALAEYDTAIALNDKLPQIWHNRGNLLRQLRRLAEAVASYERAIGLAPEQALFHNERGVTLLEMGDKAGARAGFETALARKAEYADPHFHLATIAEAEGRVADAVDGFQKAFDLHPGHERALRRLVDLRVQRGEVDRAVTALAVHAGHLRVVGKLPEAIKVVEAALQLDPQSGLLQLKLAAFKGEGAPDTLPRRIVAAVFDEYAPKFEQHLVQTLGYRGHTMVHADVMAAGLAAGARIADAGCGTGLSARLFRESASFILGIDVAPKMIEKARETGLYDELVVGDAAEALATRKGEFDLIVCTDMLVYVGESRPFFEAASGALVPGGLLGFTIEVKEGTGFLLQPSERYGHSMAYIRTLARQTGFVEERATAGPLRREGQTQVPAMSVVLRKSR